MMPVHEEAHACKHNVSGSVILNELGFQSHIFVLLQEGEPQNQKVRSLP